MSAIGINFKRYEALCVSEQQTIKAWHSGKVDFKVEYDGF
jgi:hypothetical protein